MTGPSFVQLDSGRDTGATSLEGVPIIGPKWTKLPALTIGFFGVQALWSVEMSYGAPTSELEPIHHIYTNHTSSPIPTFPGAIKIPHGHRLSRRAIIRSYRFASRRYGRRSRRSTTSILKPYNPGVLSDNSKSRFGRRRPFMIGGAAITALAITLLGFSRPVAGVFTENGSEVVCTPGTRQDRDGALITHTAPGPVTMARHIRHLRHGLLNKRRRVSCGS